MSPERLIMVEYDNESVDVQSASELRKLVDDLGGEFFLFYSGGMIADFEDAIEYLSGNKVRKLDSVKNVRETGIQPGQVTFTEDKSDRVRRASGKRTHRSRQRVRNSHNQKRSTEFANRKLSSLPQFRR